jgi:hypothetical protein
VNPNTTKSPNRKLVTGEPEYPERPEPRQAKESESAPKWKNLTLDELQSWLEEENRRQGIT